MECTEEKRLLAVSNTQRAWQRHLETNIWPGIHNVRGPLVLRNDGDGAPSRGQSALVLWLAYEHALDQPVQWCARHEAPPLRRDDVRLYQGRVKFIFRHCTGRCFQPKAAICVVLAEWDGVQVTRWGYATGEFRHGASYEYATKQRTNSRINIELEHWQRRCEQLEAENQALRGKLAAHEHQQLPQLSSQPFVLLYGPPRSLPDNNNMNSGNECDADIYLQ